MEPSVLDAPERPPPRQTPIERVRDWVSWFGPGRLVATAVSIAALTLAGFWLLRAPEPPVEDSLPMATTTSVASTPSPTSTSVPTQIVVHVAGAVEVPGVRVLPADPRVIDAITAAGGITPDASADLLNLAAPLHDGDRIYVPRVDEISTVPIGVTPASPSSSEVAGPLQLNTATAAQLEALPGIGPAIATAIVTHRDEHGPFLTVEQLADVPGIGPAKLATIRELVTV